MSKGVEASRRRDTRVGVTLALAILTAWLTLHVVAVHVIDWSSQSVVAALAMALVQTWLFVGLFIVAHDCMHGSLAPGRPAVNRWFGRVSLWLYAAFSYDRLLPDHHRHHRRPGTADDPDFCPDAPHAFGPWFVRFFLHYYGWREFLTMAVVSALYMLLLRPEPLAVLAFYVVPAIASAVQLFYFGTFRPHRHDGDAFADRHNSRTDDFPILVSLFTCFHFGYHHEHHLKPTTPWWRLPQARRASREATLPARAKG